MHSLLPSPSKKCTFSTSKIGRIRCEHFMINLEKKVFIRSSKPWLLHPLPQVNRLAGQLRHWAFVLHFRELAGLIFACTPLGCGRTGGIADSGSGGSAESQADFPIKGCDSAGYGAHVWP